MVGEWLLCVIQKLISLVWYENFINIYYAWFCHYIILRLYEQELIPNPIHCIFKIFVRTTMSGVFSLKRIAGIGKSTLSWYECWPLKPNPTTSRFPIRLPPWTQAFCSFCTCLSDENNSRPAIVPTMFRCTSLISINKCP